MRRVTRVFTNQTTVGASPVVYQRRFRGQPLRVRLELTYLTAPTVTIVIQGRFGNAAWEDVVTETYTTGSPQISVPPPLMRRREYRLNVTNIADVTIDAAYIGMGHLDVIQP